MSVRFALLLKYFCRPRRGFALVFVLLSLVLMTVMTVAFLLGMKTETSASASYSKGVYVRLLADSAIDLAKTLIQQGTSQSGTTWASQPGAIRTFDVNGPKRVYKLYSSPNLIEEATTFNAGTASSPEEIPSDWATRPNEFVDLNTPSGGAYPIMNPEAAGLVTGFSIDNPAYDVAATASPSGVRELPMPVAWLYQLRDGQIKPMDPGTKKVAGATAANPIVGRIAFWTDDETCKVNINTSGEGVFWDTPRVASTEEKGSGSNGGYAGFQPVQREFQRYPGHPFQLSLRAVLPATLSKDQVWELTPRVNSDDLGSDGGTRIGAAPLELKTQRLYASVDELLFAPTMSGSQRQANAPSTEINQDLVERIAFFATAHSRAPELNLFGLPRISMWPVDVDPTKRTAIDKWFARCATVGSSAFYMTRSNAESSTFDFNTSNQRLFNYLRDITSRPLPGFAHNFETKYGVEGRDQLAALSLDYIRTVNAYDSSVSTGETGTGTGKKPVNDNAFAKGVVGASTVLVHERPGYGQVVPLKFTSSGNTYRGLGRFDSTINEVAMLFFAMTWDDWDPDGAGPLPTAVYPVREGEGYSANPRLTKGTPYNPTGKQLYRAVLVLQPFNPMLGNSSINGNYRIRIRGLDGFKVNSNPLGFPSDGLLWVRGLGIRIQFGGPLAGYFNTMMNLPYSSSTGTWKYLPGHTNPNFNTYPQCYYPFGSAPFPLEDSATNFSFSGGTMEIEIMDTSDSVIQKLNVDMPGTTVAKPQTYTGPNIGLVNGTTGPFAGVGQIWRRERIQGTSSTGNPSILDQDVVISVEATDNATDYRWLALQDNVPSSYFLKHKDYDNTAPGAFKVAGLRSGVNTYVQGPGGNSNGSTGCGYIAPGTVLTDPSTGVKLHPKISSRYTNGVTNRDGLPGDWDTGFGDVPDGPYANKPDEGDWRPTWLANSSRPYFLGTWANSSDVVTETFYAPNRQVPSPGMFGSLPSRARESNGAWITLLFNPNPAAGDGHRGFGADPTKPRGEDPPDWLWMDMFTMPIVEPYAISEPFSTAGKINMNYQIVPFTYINRSTGLYAAMAATRVAAIHNSFAATYKAATNMGANKTIRHAVNIEETLKQFRAKFDANEIFRSASEICSLDLYPTVTANNIATGSPTSPTYSANRNSIRAFWNSCLLTGDNLREQPYTTLYQNLTTQSNTYRIHVRVQTIQKNLLSPVNEVTSRDMITGEYRGSTLVERYLNPNDPDLTGIDFATASAPSLTRFYKFRTIEQKQFLP